MLSAAFMCRAAEVQAKLRNQLRTESGPLDSSLSVPVGDNSCCSRGAAAVSPGRPRQPARSPIHSIMRHTTTTDCGIRAGVSHPVPPVSHPGMGRQSRHNRVSTLRSSGVSQVSHANTYPSHVQASVRSHTHTRNRCAQWVGQVGHPYVRLLNLPNKSLYRVIKCPNPGWDGVGHPGTPPTVRWSA